MFFWIKLAEMPKSFLPVIFDSCPRGVGGALVYFKDHRKEGGEVEE